MIDSEFFAFLETKLRGWLPTISAFRMRPANGRVLVSASSVDDFVTLAVSASAANIRCGLSATQLGRHASVKSLSSCTLELELSDRCLDTRLAHLLYEVYGIVVVKGPLENGHGSKEWSEIKQWEGWLESLQASPNSD